MGLQNKTKLLMRRAKGKNRGDAARLKGEDVNPMTYNGNLKEKKKTGTSLHIDQMLCEWVYILSTQKHNK